MGAKTQNGEGATHARLGALSAKAPRGQEAKKKTAVLLAAGRGSRLRPHTDHTPKPLLPVKGRPTLDFVLTAAVNAGFERVVLVTHYLEAQIVAYVGDGSAWGIEVAFAHQPEMLGTGHALQCAVAQRPDWFDAPFLLCATDYLLEAERLSDLMAFAAAYDSAEIVTSLKQLPIEQLRGRSSIRFADVAAAPLSQILEIVEKPEPGEEPSNYSANLIYLLPPQIVPLLADLTPSPRGEIELQQGVNQLLQNGMVGMGLLQPVPDEWHAGLL